MFIHFESDVINHMKGFRIVYTMAHRKTEGIAIVCPSPSYLFGTTLTAEDRV